MSTKIVSIIALVTLVCFLTIVGLQVAEYMYYGSPTSVWPSV